MDIYKDREGAADDNGVSLTDAVNTGNLELVKELLINDPNLIDSETFYAAAKKGDFEIVKWLVEYSRISLNEYGQNHRNVLHYAAESGNPELFRYLVEKCGMDPLEGDFNLVTPWDIITDNLPDKAVDSDGDQSKAKDKEKCFDKGKSAHYLDFKRNFIKINAYLENRYKAKYNDFYRNPIRTGFFPDPSICRVGDDYYMVNSSFIFFPCIPISHSRDLVHWEIIGHAITNPEWAHIDELEGGRGYWAPDISYYDGKFYITATLRLNDNPPVYRRQIVVSSDKPEGPYSEPAFIDEDGIDPSIFNDDDGRRYMLLNRGARIIELDKTATRQISKAQLLYYGDYKRAPEGPHLYKKDGYYYLLEAEGGTGPGHRVTVSRSKELLGEYEPCPYNPIMRQEDGGAAIQRCGHGDLVETQDGRWYMVYLCGRMIGAGYSILGRETALDPVTWTADGWPIVNNLKGPSCMQIKPFEIYHAKQNTISPCGLPLDYMTPRTFKKGDIRYYHDGDDSIIEVRASRAPLSSVESRNIVLRRQTDFSFEYEVTLEIPKLTEGQNAGITGYYDENTFFTFGVINYNGAIHLYSCEHVGDENREVISDERIAADVGDELVLTMRTDYFKRMLSCNDKIFNTLPNVYYLCDEGIKKGKRFTGALVGMYAYGCGKELKVRFKNAKYK